MFKKIIDIIADKLTLTEEQIDKIALETNIVDDLNADSIAIVEIAMDIEEKLGVYVPDEDIPTLKTVKDIVDYVESRQA